MNLANFSDDSGDMPKNTVADEKVDTLESKTDPEIKK